MSDLRNAHEKLRSHEEVLITWTIYDHPRDFPGHYVARAFDGATPTDTVIACKRLEPLREAMRDLGLSRIDRSDADDPLILETWL